MLTGNYIFLDIGAGETKIIEARLQQSGITVIKTAEMRDMSLFVSETGEIKQIEGFCQSLRQTLDEAKITTKKTIVGSSVFSTNCFDITAQYHTTKECLRNFKQDYAKAYGSKSVHTWHHFGDYKTDTATLSKMYHFSSPRELLLHFVREMQRIGLNVISIEPALSMRSYLQVLYETSYDMPYTALVDLGKSVAHCEVYKDGILLDTSDVTSELFEIADILAGKFNMPLPKINNILYNVGLAESGYNDALLASEGIPSNEYYMWVKDAFVGFVNNLKEHLAEIRERLHATGLQVIFIGGYLNMPGAESWLSAVYTYTPRRVFGIGTDFVYDKIDIKNELNRDITPKFAGCIGLILRCLRTEHSANLCPKAVKKVKTETEDDAGSKFSKVMYMLLYGGGLALAVAALLSVLWRQPAAVKVVTVTETSVTISLADTDRSVVPVGHDVSNLRFVSQNSNKLQVSEQGILTPVGLGKATVIITDTTDGTYEEYVTVTITKAAVQLSAKDIIITELDKRVSPDIQSSVDLANLVLISSNPDVVSISGKQLMPLKTGTVTVTASLPETSVTLAGQTSFMVSVQVSPKALSAEIADVKANTNAENETLNLQVGITNASDEGVLPVFVYRVLEDASQVLLHREDVTVTKSYDSLVSMNLKTEGLTGKQTYVVKLGEATKEITVSLAEEQQVSDSDFSIKGLEKSFRVTPNSELRVPFAIEYQSDVDMSAVVSLAIDGKTNSSETIVLPRTAVYHADEITTVIPSLAEGKHRVQLILTPQGGSAVYSTAMSLEVPSDKFKLYTGSATLYSGGYLFFATDNVNTKLKLTTGRDDEHIMWVRIGEQHFDVNGRNAAIPITLTRGQQYQVVVMLRNNAGETCEFPFLLLNKNSDTSLAVKITAGSEVFYPELQEDTFKLVLPDTETSAVVDIKTNDAKAKITSVDSIAIGTTEFSQRIFVPEAGAVDTYVEVTAEDEAIVQKYRICLERGGNATE